MSEYKNIEVDFVERTLKLLEKVDKQRYARYKTTHLVNLCVGLIVLPNAHDEKLDLMFQDKSVEYLRLTDNNIINSSFASWLFVKIKSYNSDYMQFKNCAQT